MNKEEAAAVLDAMIFGVYPDDDITINKIGIEAVRFAITALREKQQREDGCDTCNRGAAHFGKVLWAISKDGVAVININGEQENVQFQFCPMCGRQLSGNAEQGEGGELSTPRGEISDGYHTFNELYHHRAVLFSVIVRCFQDKAWKAKQHHDGTMYDGMFIVGIETPDGQATYHYDLDPYWYIFECKEIDKAPEWDGHSPDQAIERIGKLCPESPGGEGES